MKKLIILCALGLSLNAFAADASTESKNITCKSGSDERKLTVVEKDGGWFVSRCPELGVASQGKTRTEAHRMLAEAVGLWLESASATEIKRCLKRGARVRPLTLAHA